MNQTGLIIVLFVVVGLAFFLPGVILNPEVEVSQKWWYSSDPSRVSIDPNTGEMTAIAPGTAQICSQPSKTQTQPVQCYTVTVSSITK